MRTKYYWCYTTIHPGMTSLSSLPHSLILFPIIHTSLKSQFLTFKNTKIKTNLFCAAPCDCLTLHVANTASIRHQNFLIKRNLLINVYSCYCIRIVFFVLKRMRLISTEQFIAHAKHSLALVTVS